MGDTARVGDAANVVPDMAAIRRTLGEAGAAFERIEENVLGNRLLVYRRRLRSINDVLEGSARFGDADFLIDGDERISFAENLRRVRRVARALKATYDLKPGDRVAIFAANRWEWMVSFLALVAIGAVPAAYNGYWAGEEFAHANALVSPVLVIGDAARLKRVSDVVGTIPTLCMDDGFDALVAGVDGEGVDFVRGAEDDLAMLLFTSGTTGRSKAVMLSHRSMVGALQLMAHNEAVGLLAARAPCPRSVETMPPRNEVQLVTSPLFHIAMLQSGMLMALYRGFTLVLLRGRFDEEAALAAIERHRVTYWSVMGSIAVRVARFRHLSDYDTGSLTRVGIGGAPVSPSQQEAVRTAFPSARRSLGTGYSSTEAGGGALASDGGASFEANPASTGLVTMTIEIEIRGPDGAVLPEGELGEVHVRSPYVMLGYFANPDATAAVLKPGGWLAMGDMARLVGNRLSIDSRARDLILVNAENVSPVEVEFALEAHPKIREAAVFAVDDALTGDAVCAVVAAHPGADVGSGELADWCRSKLAAYKVPTHWHRLDGELPRNASGKLMKQIIRSSLGPATTFAG